MGIQRYKYLGTVKHYSLRRIIVVDFPQGLMTQTVMGSRPS